MLFRTHSDDRELPKHRFGYNRSHRIVPTICRLLRGWAVRIYPNDHRPPHVHVVGPAAEARFELHCDSGRVSLIDNHGFGRSELQSAASQLVGRLAELCERWGQIHG
jgi:hypothetical protein